MPQTIYQLWQCFKKINSSGSICSKGEVGEGRAVNPQQTFCTLPSPPYTLTAAQPCPFCAEQRLSLQLLFKNFTFGSLTHATRYIGKVINMSKNVQLAAFKQFPHCRDLTLRPPSSSLSSSKVGRAFPELRPKLKRFL